jgi:hypothetical protein
VGAAGLGDMSSIGITESQNYKSKARSKQEKKRGAVRPPDFYDWPEAERNAWHAINGAGLEQGSYPKDFWLWSPAKRHQYFAAEARLYRATLEKESPL